MSQSNDHTHTHTHTHILQVVGALYKPTFSTVFFTSSTTSTKPSPTLVKRLFTVDPCSHVSTNTEVLRSVGDTCVKGGEDMHNA